MLSPDTLSAVTACLLRDVPSLLSYVLSNIFDLSVKTFPHLHTFFQHASAEHFILNCEQTPSNSQSSFKKKIKKSTVSQTIPKVND